MQPPLPTVCLRTRFVLAVCVFAAHTHGDLVPVIHENEVRNSEILVTIFVEYKVKF